MREKELNMVMNRIREILANARDEVIENEKFLSIIVETVPVGIIIMDKHGGITSVNRTALQWFGLHSLIHVNQLGRINKSYPDIFQVASRRFDTIDHRQRAGRIANKPAGN